MPCFVFGQVLNTKFEQTLKLLWITLREYAHTCNQMPFFAKKIFHSFIGNGKIVETLIKHGARVNATDQDGDSALMLVAVSGS